MNEFLSVGYAVIDTIDGKEYYGGSAAGTAINAAQLGLNTGLLSAFGTDGTSTQFLEYLHTKGVSTELSLQEDDFHVPQNTLSHKDRTKGWNDSGLVKKLETSILPTDKISRFELTHLSSAHFAWVKQIFDADHNKISFSPGPKVVLDQRYAPMELLSAAEIVFFNEEEWNAVKNYYLLLSLSDLLKTGPQAIIVTHGIQGLEIAYRENNAIKNKTFVPENIPNAETTGAGDAFALGFLIGNLNGMSTDVSVELGMTLAKAVLSNPGVVIPAQSLGKFSDLMHESSLI